MRTISKDSKMKCKLLILFVVAALAALLCPPLASATPILGSDLASFAVLGATTVTNTNPATNLPLGPTTITGNVGVWKSGGANDITGLVATQVLGTIYPGGNPPQDAQTQLATAIANLGSMAAGATQLSSSELGGVTLFPGVYSFSDLAGGVATLTGILTLDGQGNANAAWVFEIDYTLTTSAATTGTMPSSEVKMIDTGSGSGAGLGLFWNVGSSATIGTYSTFEGNILALQSITLNTGATIGCGRALAYNGAVTMDTNKINSTGCGGYGLSPVPEPSTMLLLGSGLAGLVAFRKKFKKA